MVVVAPLATSSRAVGAAAELDRHLPRAPPVDRAAGVRLATWREADPVRLSPDRDPVDDASRAEVDDGDVPPGGW